MTQSVNSSTMLYLNFDVNCPQSFPVYFIKKQLKKMCIFIWTLDIYYQFKRHEKMIER